jgi:apolipoprotein N-acyltransferase
VQLTFVQKLFVASVAGALLTLAYAPFDLFWVAPLSYATLFYVWRGLRPVQAFWSGFVFGCASFFAGIHWVYVSIHDFGQVHPLLAASITLTLVVFLASYIAFTGWVAARWVTTDGPRAWFAVLPALSVLTEWCRGWLFSGFGWLAVGYSQTDSWLMGYAPLGGVYLMSWVVLITAGALLGIAFGVFRMRLLAGVGLVVLWGTGFFLDQHRWGEPTGNVLTVALVQGAVPQDLKWRPEQLEPTLELYQRLTEESEGSQLIVWPEASIPILYEQASSYLNGIRDWAAERGSIIALGILREDPGGGTFQNTLVVLGESPSFYVKRHLVPYGEVFPVPEFIRRWLRLMSLPYTDAVAGGPDQPPLRIAGENVGVTICYEDVFGAEQLHYLPEASLLINVSNDAWFGNTIAPHQHLQIARLRAAEVSRYTLRVTNTGISSVIDPRGRVVARSPQFEPHVLKSAVQGFTGRTPYVIWGNYFVILGVLGTILFQLGTTKFTIRPGT